MSLEGRMLSAGIEGRIGHPWTIAMCAALLYAVSMFLQVFRFMDEPIRGYDAFRIGLDALLSMKIRDIDVSLAWLANPAIWLAILFAARGHWRAGRFAAGCGLALGLVMLIRYHELILHGPGYWAWIGSALFLLAANRWIEKFHLGAAHRSFSRCQRHDLLEDQIK